MHLGVSGGEFCSIDIQDSPDETLQPYRFNSKESQSFAGLPYLDYGAALNGNDVISNGLCETGSLNANLQHCYRTDGHMQQFDFQKLVKQYRL